MSAKKPPPRPPLPRPSTAKSGQPTGVAPVRSLRNAFASISIRYSSSNKESDSDEEISIVRKTDSSFPEENDLDEREEENEGKQSNEVTQDKPHTRPEESSAEGTSSSKQKSPGPRLNFSNKSNSAEELGTIFEKRSVPKQKTWPDYSRLDENSDPNVMKFLRGRDRDRGQETKCDAAKDGVTVVLSEKEESDVGSFPSTTHEESGSDGKLKVEQQRSRSPSPFRRLNRQAKNVESAGERSASSSGISLSSLLASIAKEDAHVEHEESTSDTEESFSNAEAVSESLSPEDLSLGHLCRFEEARQKPPSHPTIDKSPHFTNFCFCTLLVYIYLITWTPSFVNGLIAGMLLTYLGGCAFLWLFCPEDTVAERYERELFEYEERLARNSKPEYRSVDPGLLLTREKLEGWMYKAYNYHPDKFDFSSETIPIFASLNGTKLTLSHPKRDGTGKKFDLRSVEEGTEILFSRHEHYDLTGSKVSLLPLTMTMKRVWSRKFPICIVLDKPTAVAEDITYNGSTDEDDDTVVVHKIRQQDSFEEAGVLYLFPRIGREKEEWFNHLLKLLSTDGSEQEGAVGTSCSYPHYMAKLLPQPDAKLHSEQRQIAWVNVLFGRAFWDVWHDKYWTNKIKQRFENKLAKLKKPSFIRDITISDLNLGDSLPVINKALPPVLDEQGTWVDLEVTYGGGLIFTFEGHLNIEGYLTYFLSLGNSEHGEVAADLEMAELSRKYEMAEKESMTEEPEDDCESESPPESDSDFESPESDIEEFTFRALQESPPPSSNRDQTEDGQQSETSDSVTYSSFDGDEEMMGSKDSLVPSQTSDSEGADLAIDKQNTKSRKQAYSEKQSSSEEAPSTSKRTSESAPTSPVRRPSLGLSAKHGTKRKIFSMIERLAKSKWVKKAAETGIVKRAAERFSNLPIILTVEVQTLKGTLALNIPPPPTNRLWYGFRGTPMLFVSARPKLGDRQVKLTHVSDWIEKKLKQEFRNMFVLPNMEDLPIRLMNSGLEEQFPEW